MIVRCYKPTHENYRHYGGRGIKVCDEWLSFEGFAKDMAAGFDPTLRLTRRNVDGNYDRDNCHWGERRAGMRIKRTTHRFTLAGKTQTLVEWADELGLNRGTLMSRFARGWSVEEMLTSHVDEKMRQNSSKRGHA